MKRFKDILVVYDGSIGAEDALNQAMMLATANQAKLKVVDLAEEGRYSFNMLRERERRIQRLVPAIRSDSVDNVSAKVLVGTPFLEVIKEVLKEGHDLVIASAEGGSVVSAVFFGSTVTHLIRKCPCPVWIVKPGQAVPYGRILAAIDLKLDDPAGRWLQHQDHGSCDVACADDRGWPRHRSCLGGKGQGSRYNRVRGAAWNTRVDYQ